MADQNYEKNNVQPEFKKPVLIGRIGKLPKKVKTLPPVIEPEVKQEEEPSDVPSSSSEEAKSLLPPAVLLNELSKPIPYKEPKWSGLCPDGSDYALEVLKSGCIVERIDLTTKPYYVFGRFTNCDVIMAHPTISRHHCVIQYKATATDTEPPPGWYLYELGSTYGTLLNRTPIKKSHYTRVRVGHQVKLGNSTRTFVLIGPDFDCEGESELTVTEIKKRAEIMRAERDRMIEEAKEQREMERAKEEKKRDDQGIDWGMGEDAEEEPDLADNPFAVTTNEELYLEDPKKTLRGYFEREGHELSYDCQEKGHGQYICKVELPLDDARGRPVIAEAIHTGKKKEAVVACALEACRVLDRAGLLRQAKHESRRRKSRDWSADDYYDSDDDTFLDRTGHVERKRKQRMVKHGAVQRDEERAMSYDDLLNRITTLEASISEASSSVRSRAEPSANANADELDAYIASLQDNIDPVKKREEKMNIAKLKIELAKVQRLAEIARPPHLPPLIKKDDNKMAVKVSNSVVYGKRIKLKEDAEKRLKPKPVAVKKEEDDNFVEEVDSDEEIPETSRSKQKEPIKSQSTQMTTDKQSEMGDTKVIVKKETEEKKREEDSQEVKKMYGPMRPPENYVIPDDYYNQESDRDLPEFIDKE